MTKARWLAALAQRRRYAAIGTGACLAVAVGGVMIFMPHQAGRSPRVVAEDCGIVTCTATLPPPGSAGATPGQRSSRPALARHVTPSPSPSTTAASAPPPPPAPRPAPPVTVTYSVVQRWDGGFQGQFTIVNHASTALTGWQISATFPGDLMESAWGAGRQISGTDALILDAPSYQPTIPAGGSQAANFTAQGNTTSPVSCTINGTACGR